MPYAKTPAPPYYAVIFTSLRTERDNGYGEVAERMVELVQEQDGFLGYESVREDAGDRILDIGDGADVHFGLGITVSYWRDLDSIAKWKADMEHAQAQAKGRKIWYSSYRIRIAKVELERSLG